MQPARNIDLSHLEELNCEHPLSIRSYRRYKKTKNPGHS